MIKSHFKIGDNVLITDEHPYHHSGKVGKIIRITSQGWIEVFIPLDNRRGGSYGTWVSENEITKL